MSNVYYWTPTTLDINFIKILGVSVKEKENPIGYFGTGLKYAIACLVRHNQTVFINTDGKDYRFSFKKKKLRGEEFSIVTMNGKELPFSLNFGRDWELWQAYRELHSNTLDENGIISDQPINKNGTLIQVIGDDFHKEYRNRGKIFCDGHVVYEDNYLQIREGASDYGYYRGVRAYDLPKRSSLTYNILKECTLTEDRNLKGTWDFHYWLSSRAIMSDNPEICFKLLNCPFFKEIQKFNHSDMSDVFLNTALQLKNTNKVALMYVREAEQLGRVKSDAKEYKPNSKEKEYIKQASLILNRLGVRFPDMKYLEELPANAFGLYNKATGEVFISRAAFARGDLFLASTILEEAVHKQTGFEDETRELQDWLFDRLAQVTSALIETTKGALASGENDE